MPLRPLVERQPAHRDCVQYCRSPLAPGPELDRVLYASEEDARGLVSQAVVYQAFEMGLKHGADVPKHTVLDPFCGTGSVLLYGSTMFRSRIQRVIGSDINTISVSNAAENIAQCGLTAPEPKISDSCGGDVQAALFQNWLALRKVLADCDCQDPIPHTVIQNDATKPLPVDQVAPESVSMVVTDPPHDNKVAFQGMKNGNLIGSYVRALKAIHPSLAPEAVVVFMTRERLADIGFYLSEQAGYSHIGTHPFAGDRPGARMRVAHVLKKPV